MAKQGIGGWLLLPAAFTALIPLALLANFIGTFSDYLKIWERRNRTPWPNLLLVGGEEVGNFIIIVCWFFALYLLFRKSSRYPIFSSACMVGLLILAILDTGLSSVVYQKPIGMERLPDFIAMVCIVAGWCAYMKFSKRMRNTFPL